MNKLTCYHASKHIFNAPSYEKCISNRENHSNGNLGLWFSVEASWIQDFGSNIYQFELFDRTGSQGIELPFDKLLEWNKRGFDTNAYQDKRLELIAAGFDFIKIIESRGTFDMGIVLNFESIVDYTRVSGKSMQRRKSLHHGYEDNGMVAM